ncbi:hypothetical protein KBC31_00425 [Candidatus Saccharibacteria bacterium]|nr:hypothetical protein [Candidatus Saccharibacteria bacterium]
MSRFVQIPGYYRAKMQFIGLTKGVYTVTDEDLFFTTDGTEGGVFLSKLDELGELRMTNGFLGMPSEILVRSGMSIKFSIVFFDEYKARIITIIFGAVLIFFLGFFGAIAGIIPLGIVLIINSRAIKESSRQFSNAVAHKLAVKPGGDPIVVGIIYIVIGVIALLIGSTLFLLRVISLLS